jgi:ABC-type proline/glycine betaine transport system permease subunit
MMFDWQDFKQFIGFYLNELIDGIKEKPNAVISIPHRIKNFILRPKVWSLAFKTIAAAMVVVLYISIFKDSSTKTSMIFFSIFVFLIIGWILDILNKYKGGHWKGELRKQYVH